MKKKNHINKLLIITSSILLIAAISFIILFSIQSKTTNELNEKITSLEQSASTLTEIKAYQKIATQHNAKAEEITINLADYYETWSSSEIGSASEERALERYKEELDELKIIIDENNDLTMQYSEVLQKELYTNPEDTISSNNLLYTTYEDEYFQMLNYKE